MKFDVADNSKKRQENNTVSETNTAKKTGFSVSEYSKKRREQAASDVPNQKKYTGFSVARYSKARGAGDVAKDIVDRTNAWLKNNKSFVEEYNNRYSSGNNKYRTDSADWLTYVTQQRDNYKSEADSIKARLEEYKDYFEPEFYNEINKVIDDNLGIQDKIIEASTKDKDYWSQFKDENAYNEWYKNYQTRNEMLAADVGTEEFKLKEFEDLIAKVEGMTSDTVTPETNQMFKEWFSSYEPYAKYAGGENDEITIDKAKEFLANRRKFIDAAKTTQRIDSLEKEALGSEDLDYYFQKGDSIKNPAFKDVDGKLGFLWFEPDRAEVQNIVTYAKENLNNGEFVDFVERNSAEGISGDLSIYNYIKEDEYKTYAYYLGKGDKKTADEYMASLIGTLKTRKANGYYERMEGKPALELLFAAVAGFQTHGEGWTNLVNQAYGKDPIDYSAITIASGMVREDLNNFLSNINILGNSGGQVLYDIITNAANQAIPMAIGGMTGSPLLGSLILGGSASGNAYKEFMDAGYTKDQARVYGALVGASEAGLQYALGGISKLGGKLTKPLIKKLSIGINNAFARAAIKFGGNMFSEFIEESSQELLEPLFKSLVTGEKYEAPDFDQVFYAGLLGALSAGLLESPNIVGSEVNTA